MAPSSVEAIQEVIPRIDVARRDPTVRCTFPTQRRGGMAVGYGSCGAEIPFHPKRPCPECGEKQVNAVASRPPEGARIIEGNGALVDEDGVTVALTFSSVRTRRIANEIADELRSIKWDAPVNARDKPANEARLSGIVVTHRTFGFQSPVPLRRRYACSRSRFDEEYPRASSLIGQFTEEAELLFAREAESVHDLSTVKVREEIPEAWRIRGTPWTSGIINHTAALPYHRDSGNIKGSWSAMLGVRRECDGGLLHLVDYDVWLAIPNGSISIFDGQSVLHGVSPFRLTKPSGYRFTLVTYARRGMRVCAEDPADEAHRAKLAATKAEDERLERMRAGR